MEVTSISAWDEFSRKKILLYYKGFPSVRIGGFPNCPLGSSQIGNSRPKMSVITVEYHSQDGPLETMF